MRLSFSEHRRRKLWLLFVFCSVVASWGEPAAGEAAENTEKRAAVVDAGDESPRPSEAIVKVATITLTRASSTRDGFIDMQATLENGGGAVVATSTDISFDATVFHIARNTDMTPLCKINRDLTAESIEKRLAVGERRKDTSRPTLRVGVLGLNNSAIPDGLLFTCRFRIDVSAPLGPHVLRNESAASTASATEVPIVGEDSVIVIE